jgi:cytochrome c oxidase subunit 3
MTISLLLLAGLMGVIVWWLFKQSINVRPWLAQGSIRDVHERVLDRPAAKTALWIFLAVATSLFALFISAYAMRMHLGDWQPLPEPMLLWWNTALLVATSVVMQRTVLAARRADAGGLRTGLIGAGALTLAFLVGQVVAWRQLSAAGYFLTSNPANGFFYLLTAVHSLHVLGGLVAWGRTASRVWHGADAPSVRLSVELCAIYWHFLLVVWLVLFALLLST